MLELKMIPSKIDRWFGQQKINFKENQSTFLVLAFLLFWLNLFLSQEINLVNIDLGRHIENGRIFFENRQIPTTNLYSYTFTDASFINHHWGSGLIFYWIWKYAGFWGLSFLYLSLSWLTFSLLFLLAKKIASLPLAFWAAVLTIPLIGERAEVRPEVFSYFLAALFFVWLWRFKKDQLPGSTLFWLPIIMLFWVNLHIYFMLGIGLVGLFGLEALIEKRTAHFKRLLLILALTVGAGLINPFGIKGLVYPLNIFRNYGYRVLENQSVGFLTQIGFIHNPNLIIFKITLLTLGLSFVLLLVTNRKKVDWALWGMALVVGFLGWQALRNFALFGYFALPAIAYNLRYGLEGKFNINGTGVKIFILGASIFFLAFFNHLSSYKFSQKNQPVFYNKTEAMNASAIFFKENKLSGPIFNNYDIGGFLIFHLFPQEKVFVDNRPEAYPDYFFTDVYVPMQENNDIWKQQLAKYNFNVIFFATADATNWGQEFLVKRINDPDWAPVFVDQFTIIFLRRNEKNKELIARFEIPAEKFKITTP